MSFRVCLGATIALAAQSAHALDPAWLAKANANISALEYAPTMAADKAVMNNRTQGFRSEAIADRVEVRSRENGTALVALTLERFGRDGAWLTPGGETQAVNGDRLEIRRSDIVEWFVNRPSGLEQGFDIAQRPAGTGDLVLAIDTDHAALKLEGDAVYLRTHDRELSYSKLIAFDASGRHLPATMAIAGDNIELRIDDSKARYPVVIDPILTGTIDDTFPGTQVGAELGRSAAIVGDVNGDGFPDVVLGAPEWDGTAGASEGAWFLFLGQASGFPAAANASGTGQLAGAKMGSSLAALGDTNGDGLADFAVGVPFGGSQTSGQTRVYYGRTTLPLTASIVDGTQVGEFLGVSVSGAGDVNGDGYADLIVGSPGFDGAVTNTGRAQIFGGGASGVSNTPLVELTTGTSDIRIGTSVAGVGDVNADGFADVLVGAPEFESPAAETNEGAAFLYLGGASFNNVIDATLQINQTEARFGSALSGGGDVNGDGYSDMLVGAPLHDNGTTNGGSAFLFLGSATPTSPTIAATYTGSQTGADFGRALSILGDINGDGYSDVAVSAPLFESAAAQTDEGLVNVYVGAAVSPPAIPIVSIQSNEAGVRLGTALHGGLANRDGYADLLVGAALADPSAALTDAGAGYLYFGGPRLPNDTASSVQSGTQGSSFQGWSLAVGDFNADGIGDFATGLFGHDSAGGQNTGAVRLFRGRPASQGGPVALPLIEFSDAEARFGASVALGDLNSDGFSDLLVGVPFYSNGQAEEGAAMIFFSNAGAFSATPSVILQSNVVGARAGTSVAIAGDINGDGNVDILVGAPNVGGAGLGNQGAAYVYLNQGGSFAATPSVTFTGGQANALFGTTVAGLGDVNGDGRADIGIGAPGFTDVVANAGQLRVYYGSANFNPTAADFIKTAAGIAGRFGSALAGADVNGDGFSDLFAGAPTYTIDQATEGAAFLYLGSAQGLDPVPNARIESNQIGARLGGSIASAGDLNDDGAADIIVGVSDFDDVAVDQGAGFVYLGTRGGAFNSTVDLVLEGATTATARSGFSVASGDINGDGVADLLMGVINEDPPGVTDAGAVRIYAANLSGQLQARSANYVGAPGAAIDAWGVSNVGNGFVVNGTAFSVRGRERTKLEVEACPAGQPFGAGSCVVATGVDWRQILPTGTALTTVVLVPEGMYRWRARNLYLPSVAGTGDISLVEAGPWRRRLGGTDVIDVRVTDNLFRNGFEN